jgi:hypothetical protein
MKNLALLISLLGLLFLFLYIRLSLPIEISNQIQMSSLEDNQKALISSNIKEIKIYPSNILIKLENNIAISCIKPCQIKEKAGEKIKIIATYNKFYDSFDFKKEIE